MKAVAGFPFVQCGSWSACQSPEMANGRWRILWGPTPGLPKGNRNAFKRGRYTGKSVDDRKKITALLRAMRELAKAV